MKTCSKCAKLLPYTAFYKQSDRTTGASSCKSCFNKYCIERWVTRKFAAVKYKGGCCSFCGYKTSLSALEFHHTNPSEKDFDWGKLRLTSWEKIKNELDKCILLCANCHREEHDRLLILSKLI